MFNIAQNTEYFSTLLFLYLEMLNSFVQIYKEYNKFKLIY